MTAGPGGGVGGPADQPIDRPIDRDARPLPTATDVDRTFPLPTLDEVLGALDVRRVDDDRFEADSLRMGHGRVYGGQVLGQVVVAATRRLVGKQVKSLHLQFARDGRADDPVGILTDVVHEGSSFASTTVRVVQGDRVLAIATVLGHRPGEGPEQQTAELRHREPDAAVEFRQGLVPLECRVVGGVNLRDRSQGPAEYAFWLRDPALTGVAPEFHQGLVAYTSDLTLIGTALRNVDGYSQLDFHHRLQTATTAHTVWFHRPVALERWTCFQQDAPVTTGGRSFGRGQVFDPDGVLVASYAQDGLARWLEARPGQVPRTKS